MRFLIIGASGLVGANCVDYMQYREVDVIGTHLNFPTSSTVFFDTLNPDDPANFDTFTYRPDVVVHCGALTNVDFCETHYDESYMKTVSSTANVVSLCKKLKAKLVYISSDYVFDGKHGPYFEDEQPNPINVYGKHKLAAERIVQQELSDALILRVTNVYGNELRNKNFISRILQNISDNKAIDVILPFDQFATPINALDIAKAIYLLILKNSTGLYHLGSTDYYSRYQLFMKVIEYFPFFTNYSVRTVSTKQLNQLASRPLLGGLLANKFLNENPDFNFSNVDKYLRTITVNISK